MPRSPLRRAACCVVIVLPGAAGAAGGQHAVDDAAIADPGWCQVETWFDRELGGARSLAIGLVVGSVHQESADTGAIHGILVPFTWRPDPALQWHLNIGRDLRRDGSTSHAGVAVEWAALPRWSFVGERFREQRANRWRVGVRWSPTPAGAPATATLGVTWNFQR